MWKIVKMPIADWLSYPPPLYINIGFGLRPGFLWLEIPTWNRFGKVWSNTRKLFRVDDNLRPSDAFWLAQWYDSFSSFTSQLETEFLSLVFLFGNSESHDSSKTDFSFFNTQLQLIWIGYIWSKNMPVFGNSRKSPCLEIPVFGYARVWKFIIKLHG